ncbi:MULTISPECIES: MSMEG_0568 family radical SAM protein [unclassified Parafrankia]|uniref:MSMEG_0568 family radical SAM protein n=1 Tax=unclassified Parafrankia TaxID=2994368 RepID=UPI000DA4A4C5|nr:MULTISPECIES: MSMEG_0568 family radical SAM protein [unclassified Parafrankia]TCJ33425.1 MSMEG_0568 family radical SAM protein [Parafrankia sp. BMG5.11]CAI7974269.1 MSMEG_0568 family radical SAM protein [Frankia sp. Hr75.2]SQD96515.1 Radical SAM domain protein [Parafrankia sp. Ea1.12]
MRNGPAAEHRPDDGAEAPVWAEAAAWLGEASDRPERAGGPLAPVGARPSGGLDLAVRSAVAVRGVRVATPVRRRGGAGPSDDGHVVVAGRGLALPIIPSSPYSVDAGRLLLDGVDLGIEARPVRRPRFYDLSTADGVPYSQLARLHGADVLATTVLQTCVRYREPERCRFCAIEESLRAGATTRLKTPGQLAEVALAAVRLDGVRQMVMTTGSTAGPDRGASLLAECVRAVTDAVPGLPVQVQCEPPADPAFIGELRAAGASTIGIHIESLDEAVRQRWTPGKATVSVERYERAWAEAVRVFGRNRVSTYLLIGLGEDPDELVAGARRLIAMGVYPFVVPFRPMAGTLAERDGARAPEPALVADVTARVAAELRAAGMRGADQGAGCAACGACSALPQAGG